MERSHYVFVQFRAEFDDLKARELFEKEYQLLEKEDSLENKAKLLELEDRLQTKEKELDKYEDYPIIYKKMQFNKVNLKYQTNKT